MSTQDLGAQLNLANQLRESLGGVVEMFEKLGSTAGSQADSISQLAGSMREAAENTNPEEINDMDAALQSLAGSLNDGDKATKKFTKGQIAAAGAISGAVAGFKAFKQTLGATFNAVGSLTTSMFNLAKGGFGALKGTYEGILGIAQDVAAAGDQVAQAYEDLRGEFGNIATNEGKAVADSFRDLKSSGNGLAGTGLSLGRIYGPNNFAGALKDLQGLAGELGASFNRLQSDFKNNAAELLVLNKGLGISAKGFAGLADLAKQSGMDTTEALHQVAQQSAVLSKKFGVSSKVIGKNLSQLTENMAEFGHMSTAELTATATYAAKLGVEIQSLSGMFDKFSNFEDAATGAAKLAETFGMNVDAMELMNAESPAEQMDMMRKAFMETGRSLDDLSRQEKAYLAEQMGVDANDLYGMFDPANADLSFDDIVAESEAAQEKMSPEEALADAAKNIQKSIESAMKEVKGFFDAFIQGFERGLKYTKLFMGASRKIRAALREVFNIGVQLAQKLFGDNGVFGKNSNKHLKTLQNALDEVIKFFRFLSDQVVLLAKGMAGEAGGISFGQFAENMYNKMKEFFGSEAFQAFGSKILNGLTSAVNYAADNIPGLIDKLIDGINNGFKDSTEGAMATPMGKALAKLFDTLVERGPEIADALIRLAETILGKIKDYFMDNPTIFLTAMAAMFGPAIIMGMIKGIAAGIGQMLIMTVIPQMLAALPAIFSAIGTFITGPGLAAVLSSIGGFLTTIGGFLLSGLSAIGSAFVSVFTSAAAVVVGKIIAAAAVIYGTVMSFFQTITRIFDRFGDDSKGIFEKIVGTIVDIFMFIPRAIVNIVNLITETFFGFNIVEPFDNAVDMIIDMFVFLKDDLFGFVGNVIGFFTNGGITEAVNGVVAGIIGFFTGAPQAMYDGLMGFVGMLAGFGSAVLDGIMAPFNMMGEKIAGAASDAWNSFKGVFGISSPSKEAQKAGGAIVDGFTQGTENLDSSIKGPSQKTIDKLAKNVDKLDTSGLESAGEKFMSLEDMAASLSNITTSLKDLQFGDSGKKMKEAAIAITPIIEGTIATAEAVKAFGDKMGKDAFKLLNADLAFYSSRIVQIAEKITSLSVGITDMVTALNAMIDGGGVNTETVVRGLKGIFGESAEDEKAFIPQVLKTFLAIGRDRMKQLNAEMSFYTGRVQTIAGGAQQMAESFDAMIEAWDKIPETTQAAMNVQENVKVLTEAINAVNTSFQSLPEIDAVADVSRVAAALVSDGTVTVQHENMNINVHFKVNIDSKQLAAALGDDAEGGPFFVINTDRGGGASSAESAGE